MITIINLNNHHDGMTLYMVCFYPLYCRLSFFTRIRLLNLKKKKKTHHEQRFEIVTWSLLLGDFCFGRVIEQKFKCISYIKIDNDDKNRTWSNEIISM